MNAADSHIPVIAIDGPSASGKGTVAQQVAQRLHYHYLDSGALYRAVALAALQQQIDWQDSVALMAMMPRLTLRLAHPEVWLNGQEVNAELRQEAIGNGASQIAQNPQIRLQLLDMQRQCRQLPGLVADGRDMGSVIFPDAQTRIFLTASVEVRAKRRYQQLLDRGIDVSIQLILQDLRERDMRDSQREIAPLQHHEGAIFLDTSQLSIAEAVQMVLDYHLPH